MRTHRHKRRVHHLLIENKIIADVKQQNIKYCIAAATCCIPEGLHGHDLFEWWVEPINYAMNKSYCAVDHKKRQR